MDNKKIKLVFAGLVIFLILLILITSLVAVKRKEVAQYKGDQEYQNTGSPDQINGFTSKTAKSENNINLPADRSADMASVTGKTDPSLKKLPVMNRQDTDKLARIIDNLPDNQDFAVTYSAPLNRFYIHKKTPDADNKISEWAKQQEIEDIIVNGTIFEKVEMGKEDPMPMEERVYEESRYSSQNAADGNQNTTSQSPTGSLSINKPTAEMKQQNGNNPDINGQTDTQRQTELKEGIDYLANILKIVLNSGFTTLSPAPTENPPTPSAYPPPASQPFNPYITPPAPLSPLSLSAIFQDAGSKIGVPAKILEAVAFVEYPTTFNYNNSQVAEYSSPGNGIPGCKPNSAGASGPMQFIPSTWAFYGYAVNKYGGYSHSPYVCNIRDSVYAAAWLLKRNSLGSGPDNWTETQVRSAIENYGGKAYCRDPKYRQDRLGGRNYCEYVWWFYNK